MGRGLPTPATRHPWSAPRRDDPPNLTAAEPRWHPYDAANGKDGTIEANVAALFHDLIDDGTESGDLTSYSAEYIADVFKSCWITNSAGRRSHRNKVSDFVWCLEIEG
ncbi:MAG: hypothetical protein OXH49_05425 [Gemmatimonadetes bacterium]|nr:hypothetical protein [Gemmatimonadota bacterium]